MSGRPRAGLRFVRLAALGLVAMLSLAGECGGGGGSGGLPVILFKTRLDARCPVLPSVFPPGFEFIPGNLGRIAAANFSPSAVLTIDVNSDLPFIVPTPPIFELPDDSDGDGIAEGSPIEPDFPRLDDIVLGDPALAGSGIGLLTASGYEEVIFFRQARAALQPFQALVPAGFPAGDYPRLPAPGTAATRTAITTRACIKPDVTLDSRGADYAAGLPAAFFCDPARRGSFYGRFTSGAAVAAGRLFVSMSNLVSGAGSSNPQYLPGAVLVYDVDLASDPPTVAPNPSAPFIITTGFNPTHVTRYAVGGREFVLVTLTGAIGIVPDDPNTPDLETGTVVLTDGVIDVIDAQTLRVVARYPLGSSAPSFDRLAIDPSGRVAVTGSAAARWLLAVDLAPLATLPGNPAAPLDLSGSVVFDAAEPLRIPPLVGGPSPATCPGFTGGVAFNHAGDRIFVTERCDGTLSTLGFGLPDPGDSVLPAGFAVLEREPFVAPLVADTLGRPRDPGKVRVRPGRPGVDYTGPDVFVSVNQPEGSVCGVRIESR